MNLFDEVYIINVKYKNNVENNIGDELSLRIGVFRYRLNFSFIGF